MIIVIAITLLFIVLRFTVTLFNFISNPKLTRVNRSYTDLVSILIPARNEASNILTLLQSIHQQDYKNNHGHNKHSKIVAFSPGWDTLRHATT